MSQRERTERHKENNPGGEAHRKAKQRQRDEILRFHIVRNHLYGYELPKSVDEMSAAFKRVRDKYLSKAASPVEVVEVMK